MADYKVTDTELTSIANAIRTKGGTQAQFEFPTGFVSAVQAIPTGGGVVQPLNVTQNGTYNPPSGVDGYAPVTVNVSGGSDVYEEWDFTDSFVGKKKGFVISSIGVEITENGAVFNSTKDYLKCPLVFRGMTIELDIVSMDLTSASHRRFIMVDDGNGFIYRNTGKWSLYNGSWATDSDISSGAFFSGSTLKIYIDMSANWHIYKNDQLVYEPNRAQDTPYSGYRYFMIGSTDLSINNAVISALRIK